MKIASVVSGTSALLLLCGAAQAGVTIHVPQDMATIQEAVDSAVADDVIMVSPGFYRENLVILTSGITLKGPKATIDGAYAGTVIDVQADDVTITGFDIVNGGTAGAPGDVGTGGGISYTGSGAFITKVEVSGSADFGIQLAGTGRVEDCTVAACLGTGILLDSGDPSAELTTVKVNEVYRCGSGIVADDGPFLFDRNIVSNNTGDGLSLTVLAAAGDGTTGASTELTRNEFVGNGGTGLLINDEVGAVTLIEKNDVIGNEAGLDLTGADFVVSKNDIQQNRAGGVFLHTTGTNFQDNKVGRNTLIGVLVAATEGATDGTNTLFNNKFEANGGDGVHITSGANTVDKNYFKDNKGDAIQIAAGAVGTTVTNCMVRENKHDGIDNWGTETLISDNVCKDNTGADLAGVGDGAGTVDAASTGNEVKDGTARTSVQELELDTLTP